MSESADAARRTMIEYATSEQLPVGLNVTLFVGGSLFAGRVVPAATFIDVTKKNIASAVRAESPRLASDLEAIDTSGLDDDPEAPFVHFACDTWISANGVSNNLAGVIFKLRRSAIAGFVFGTLSIAGPGGR